MKINEPIGNPLWAPFFIRISIGIYFLLSGKAKLSPQSGLVLPEFVKQMRGMNPMPDQLSTVWAILLPYLEIVVGLLLIAGLWMTLSAGLSSILICSFIYIFGLYESQQPLIISKDILILCASFSLMYSGAGAMSIDRFKKGG